MLYISFRDSMMSKKFKQTCIYLKIINGSPSPSPTLKAQKANEDIVNIVPLISVVQP